MKLSQLDILRYALDGVRTEISAHPAPCDYPEDIDHLEKVERELERRIKQREKKEEQHEST